MSELPPQPLPPIAKEARARAIKTLDDFLSSNELTPEYRKFIEDKIFSFISKIEVILDLKFDAGAEVEEKELNDAISELRIAFERLKRERINSGPYMNDTFLGLIETIYISVMGVKYKYREKQRIKALMELWPIIKNKINRDIFYYGGAKETNEGKEEKELPILINQGLDDYLMKWINDSKLWVLGSDSDVGKLLELTKRKDFDLLIVKFKAIKRELGNVEFLKIWEEQTAELINKISTGNQLLEGRAKKVIQIILKRIINN